MILEEQINTSSIPSPSMFLIGQQQHDPPIDVEVSPFVVGTSIRSVNEEDQQMFVEVPGHRPLINNANLFEPVDGDEVVELLATDSIDMANERRYSVSHRTMQRYATKYGFKGVAPILDPKIIENCNKFRVLITKYKDKWVLQNGEKPVFENGWCDLVLNIFFYVINTFYKVRIAQVASAFDLENADHKKDWCGIMSHICYELGDE
jgi:hypothetical protein